MVSLPAAIDHALGGPTAVSPINDVRPAMRMITGALGLALGVKTRRMVTPGDRMLRHLIQLLFPGSGKGHDRRLTPCFA
jgi:hypothetical protein